MELYYAAIKFDPSVSANWVVANGAAAETSTTTTTAVSANTWYKGKIVIDGSNVRFYVDNVHMASHSTNAPTQAGNIVASVQTNTTAARTLDVDYIKVYSYGLTR